MSRLRLGLCGLAVCTFAIVASSARARTQAAVDWNPVDVRPVDRGVMRPTATSSPQPRRAAPLRAGERRGRTGAVYAAGRILVKFRPGMSTTARAAAASRAWRTASMTPRPAAADFDEIAIGADDDAEQAAAAFAGRADVEYAQPAYRVYPLAVSTFVPNDPLYAQLQWNFPSIDLESGWAIQHGASSSIVIAIVDSGLAFQSGFLAHHAFQFCSTNFRSSVCGGDGGTLYPELGDLSLPMGRATDIIDSTSGATGSGRIVAPKDFIWNTELPFDLDGHGTHVTGTLGELTNNASGLAGIAFNAKLMPVKVISAEWDDIFRSPNQGTDDMVALGIRWAADHGANVINMSIGRNGPADCGTAPTLGCAPIIEDAIRYAVGKGCFIAIAAGNDFEDGNETEVMAEIASRVNGAVSVAATDRNNHRAYYSNTAPWVELAAPGGSDRTDPVGGSGLIYQQSYDIFNFVYTFDFPVSKYKAPRFDVLGGLPDEGTSMATPHVSGVAALLMAQGIKDPAAVEAALEKFATPCSETQNLCSSSVAPNHNNSFGYGRVDARNTLRGLGLAK